jgi:hypothetical protein
MRWFPVKEHYACLLYDGAVRLCSIPVAIMMKDVSDFEEAEVVTKKEPGTINTKANSI